MKVLRNWTARHPVFLQAARLCVIVAAPLTFQGCGSRVTPVATSKATGLGMETVAFDKSILTAHLPGYNAALPSQNFFVPFRFRYSHAGQSINARIQLSSERQWVATAGDPTEESLLRIHWEYLSGSHAGRTLDLFVGHNRMRVTSDIDCLRYAGNPTHAGLTFIVDEILGPLRSSDLSLPPLFFTVDEKLKAIVAETCGK